MKTLFLIVQECKMRTFRVILDAYWVLEAFRLLHIHRYLLIHCLGIFMCLHWMTATSQNSPKYVVQLVAGHWLQCVNLIVRQSSILGIRISLRVWAGSWCLWLIVKPFKSLVTMGTLEQGTVLVKTCHSAGWCVDPRIVPWGGWMGQEEQLSCGGQPHATGVSHAHHPL